MSSSWARLETTISRNKYAISTICREVRRLIGRHWRRRDSKWKTEISEILVIAESCWKDSYIELWRLNYPIWRDKEQLNTRTHRPRDSAHNFQSQDVQRAPITPGSPANVILHSRVHKNAQRDHASHSTVMARSCSVAHPTPVHC